MSRVGLLCRDRASTLRFHDNRASTVSWDSSIVMPASRLEIFQVITLAQVRNRTAGNTLLVRAASNLYIKMAAPG